MRVERVEAHVFGPLKGETLELAPGLTVVHGPNEAGKSSWHAALYAGLCGRRRGPGAGTLQDRAFAERHRPWHSERWEVGVVVALADGRRVEVRQDLAGGVDCRATDLALGRDVSDEVMFEGAPDGARWLGLNRRTLPATVCVRQADVLSLLEDPGQLQEALQRAAATGGADATAEQALAAITTFRRERIGVDRRNATKPLRQAVEAAQRAAAALAAAREAHEEYVRLVARRDEARAEAERARTRLSAARRASERAAVDALAGRVERARALSARVGDGPPPEPPGDDALAERVTAVLAAYDACPPAPVPLDGEDAGRLAAALEALPEPPRGDTAPAPGVLAAHDVWKEARQALRAHDRARPPQREAPDAGGLDAADLRALADAVERGVPEVDAALRAEVEGLREAANRPRSLAAAGLLAVAAVALAAAGVTAATGALLAAAGTGMLALAAVAAAAVTHRRSRPALSPSHLAAVETRLALAEERAAEARQHREEAARRLVAAGLEVDAAGARRLARALEEVEHHATQLARWGAERERLAGEQAEAATRLWEALRQRGETLGAAPDPGLAFGAYEHACRHRAALAAQAARRGDLSERLRARRAAEAEASDREARRRAVLEALAAATRSVGEDPAGQPDELAARLRAWLGRRARQRREQQQAREAWVELQHVLDGRGLDELVTELRERQAALGDDPPPARPGPAPAPTDLVALEEAAGQATRTAAHLEGRVTDREQDLPDVAGAEERLARAEEQLAGLRRLDATLETTRRFLESARDRVHRDIAPQLKAAVERRLAVVTGERYDQVMVDPATLEVQVRAGTAPWRSATGLSHGTAEQVYLLLRLAMAEHLVSGDEVAPLVLDDVTVQSDGARTRALLGLLHEVSRQRQVVIFTQEDAVLAWAEAHLRGPRDALVRLEPIGVAL